MLLAMQYKTFVWANNPKSYTLSCERLTAAHKIPLGDYCVQDLGRSCTVLRGEGEFFGAGAYTQFRRLMEVFRSPGAGALRHPVWQCSRAYFTRLELAQEPREDYVAYSFEFCDAGEEQAAPEVAASSGTADSAAADRARTVTVRTGDTLWALCRTYGLTMKQMLALNPKIRDPDLIYAGEELRIG